MGRAVRCGEAVLCCPTYADGAAGAGGDGPRGAGGAGRPQRLLHGAGAGRLTARTDHAGDRPARLAGRPAIT